MNGEHTDRPGPGGRGDNALHRIDDAEPSAMRTAAELIKELALLLPSLVVLIGRLMADPRVPRRRKILAAVALAYLASPIDLIPDVVPVIGQADDVVLAAFAVHHLIQSVPPDVREEYWLGSVDSLDLVSALVAWGAELVPSTVRRLLGA